MTGDGIVEVGVDPEDVSVFTDGDEADGEGLIVSERLRVDDRPRVDGGHPGKYKIDPFRFPPVLVLMPSLRRSFSSPSVRSSPYPSSTNTTSTRSRPAPRRPSPSATAERRVLADIEWWRVFDGQCDPDHTHEDPHELEPGVPPGGLVTLSAGGDSLEPHSVPLDSIQVRLLIRVRGRMPTAILQRVYPTALSIAPYSPPGSPHSRDSSVESTPELPTAPLETVQLGLADSCPFGDLFAFPSSLARGGRQVHPLFGSRSISAPGLSYQVADFADMGGDSFSLHQNLFQ